MQKTKYCMPKKFQIGPNIGKIFQAFILYIFFPSHQKRVLKKNNAAF